MMFVDANCAVSLKHSAVAHSIYFSFCSHEKAASREETALDGSRTANSLRAQEENLNISKCTLKNYQMSKLHLKYANI